MVQIVANLVEPLLRDIVKIVIAQVPPVDDCIDVLIRVRFQVPTAFDTSDTLEA